MSYNGRRGPNVSQYIAGLNTIQPVEDLPDPLLNMDEDMALFTNTEFIDWDHGSLDVPQPLDYDPVAEQRARRMNASRGSYSSATKEFGAASKPEFLNSDFQFQDFSGFNSSITDPQLPNLSQNTPAGYPLASYGSPVSNSASPVSPQFGPGPGEKRKLDAITDPNGASGEEPTRVAAEEDKRRRNTAASARFRVKKKQREQALEKTAKDMTDKVGVLETKITQLEMENKWLKSLITEKNESSADVSAMFKKFQQTQETAGERSTGQRTDGVGTGADHKQKAKA
ncbi:uncharacterized protein BDZ99DRAFT_488447 [Mytilinidion resinicola]|uniref:BZIP domain-containing protein n=1 Tax=Mytilinidion resinicola TaxID=574789 RepID=A0A6A6YL39_9PEZI|nr:uncharacterized protein BDZ99DRAFT_488447 [Mytilinidion resinicola]KAF2809520.1 hypothetical protein BDZ99DRAFT_488447 [Mytilinidion resinicola]